MDKRRALSLLLEEDEFFRGALEARGHTIEDVTSFLSEIEQELDVPRVSPTQIPAKEKLTSSNKRIKSHNSHPKAAKLASQPSQKLQKPKKNVGKKQIPTRSVPQKKNTERIAHEDHSDIDLSESDSGAIEEVRRFVVAVDFGTTFTSVSYYAHPAAQKTPVAFPIDVKSIMNWPMDATRVRKQMPTESWYLAIGGSPRATEDQLEDAEVGNPASSVVETSALNRETWEPRNQRYSGPYNIETGPQDSYLWGYEVPHARYVENTTRNPNLRIERSKSMLVASDRCQDDRTILKPRLEYMIKIGLIKRYGKSESSEAHSHDVQDVISDFLSEVLRHTGQQLIEQEAFTADCPVSFVLTVPVKWFTASSRVLQAAMEVAIRESGFGTLGYGCIDNLFITTEPEAAATYLMGSSKDILPGETIIVLDCGGGTVDCVTYKVTIAYPLRLEKEIGEASWDNYGGSYLNDNYHKLLMGRLRDEDYLDYRGETRLSIVNRLIPNFEDYDKRFKDITKRCNSRVYIRGLRGDKAKRFVDNYLELSTEDYKKIFDPILKRVKKVLKAQLELSSTRDKPKKVFLVGGFGGAPSLRSVIGNYIRDFTAMERLKYEIALISPPDHHDSATTVASGAVLRALNKEKGPKRTAFSSYGFLRIEPYQPEMFEGHRQAQPFTDKLDGEKYVTTIDYFIVMKDVIQPVHEYDAFKTYHAFDVDNERLLCEEILYVNDNRAAKSHFALDDLSNKDAQIVGKIITDMTFLVEEGKLPIIFPTEDDDGNFHGRDHYMVEYDLVPIVEGRNLRYEAKYPANQFGKVQKRGQISIAAAFKPGTA